MIKFFKYNLNSSILLFFSFGKPKTKFQNRALLCSELLALSLQFLTFAVIDMFFGQNTQNPCADQSRFHFLSRDQIKMVP